MNAAPEDRAPTLEVLEGIARLTLRRPRQHNRLDPDDIAVMHQHIQAVQRDVSVRLLVLSGEGDKTFCSGYTLGQIGARLDSTLEDMLNALERLEVPTLCVLNGSAYGGGTDLALACDFRVGVRGMKIFMPATRFGIHYYPGGLRRFVARLGPTAAKKIFLTGMSLEDDELLRIGYLTDLVERDGLDVAAKAYCDAISLGDPASVRSTKRHIDAIMSCDWDEASGRAAHEESLRAPETIRRLAPLGR